ncbi:MAG: hypothetical protein WC523_04860 [Patescibacteria group bacterium]
MASVFKNEQISEQSILEIIKNSIDVDAVGTVRFRSRLGRGSGKAIEIPGDQFDEFVNLMIKTKEVRKSLTETQNTETNQVTMEQK